MSVDFPQPLFPTMAVVSPASAAKGTYNVHIYIYIEREMYVCVCMCVYIYIYVHT